MLKTCWGRFSTLINDPWDHFLTGSKFYAPPETQLFALFPLVKSIIYASLINNIKEI